MKKSDRLHKLIEASAGVPDKLDFESRAALSLVERLKRSEIPQSSPAARARCLSAVRAASRSRAGFSLPSTSRALHLAWTAVTLLAITAVGWSAVGLSKRSLPGDVLYPVKRISERGYLIVCCNQGTRPAARLTLANERLEETVMLAGEGRVHDGTLREMVRQCELAIGELETSGAGEAALHPVVVTCRKQEAMLRALLPHAAASDTTLLRSAVRACSLMHSECQQRCALPDCGMQCKQNGTRQKPDRISTTETGE